MQGMAIDTQFNKAWMEFIWQTIESDPERFRKITGAVIQPVTKQKLTTKEMCEQLNINYHSWHNLRMSHNPEIIKLKDPHSGRSDLYHVDDLGKIEEIWKNRRKWNGGR